MIEVLITEQRLDEPFERPHSSRHGVNWKVVAVLDHPFTHTTDQPVYVVWHRGEIS